MKANLQRAFQILELIKDEPHKWACGKLAIRFGISKQQIHRYIKGLRENGFDIQRSSQGDSLIEEKHFNSAWRMLGFFSHSIKF